jgi:hypothetical protein
MKLIHIVTRISVQCTFFTLLNIILFSTTCIGKDWSLEASCVDLEKENVRNCFADRLLCVGKIPASLIGYQIRSSIIEKMKRSHQLLVYFCHDPNFYYLHNSNGRMYFYNQDYVKLVAHQMRKKLKIAESARMIIVLEYMSDQMIIFVGKEKITTICLYGSWRQDVPSALEERNIRISIKSCVLRMSK